jgi:CRP/FNR family transcriptional regulator, anaerobic regulatory protein
MKDTHVSFQEAMASVIRALNRIRPLSVDLIEALHRRCVVKYYPKGSYLLHAGSKADKLFFLASGYVRIFCDEPSKTGAGYRETNKWFLFTGDIAISVVSFYKDLVSDESMIAEEDTVAVSLDHKTLNDLCEEFPEFLWHRCILTEEYYCIALRQRDAVHNKTGEQSYDYLVKHFAALIQRVSAKHLASFLGVNETYISDIRAKHARKRK